MREIKLWDVTLKNECKNLARPQFEKFHIFFIGTPGGESCNYPEGSFAPVPDETNGLCLCKVSATFI